MKTPAVLLYTSDFLTGTSFMNNDQVGAYIRLLCYQHQLGHLKKEYILSITKDEIILSKFIEDKNGLFYNERMGEEIEKRESYSKSRSKNRSKIKAKPKKDMKNICNSYDNHMENENDNRNSIYINNNLDNNKIEIVREREEDIYSFVEKNFGRTLSSIEYEEIMNWEDNELTGYAIKQAVLNGVCKIKYIMAILYSYEMGNIKSVQQAQEQEKQFKQRNVKETFKERVERQVRELEEKEEKERIAKENVES